MSSLRENPYVKLARLDKPIGTWLLYLPGAWSISLASEPGQVSDLWLLSLFGMGAVLLRGAGCTINDLWDSRLDGLVERSKSRPLASGVLTKKQALFFVTAQLLGGLPILLSLNMYSQVLGASSLFLVTLYPLAKRVTFWPQLVLGLTFNWGALLGWVAVKGSLDLPALYLYGGGVAWTLIYDTIYAHQDKHDDTRVGIRSTALYFGDKTDSWLYFFAGIHSTLMLLVGYLVEQTSPYYNKLR
ncbi:4-hydroxybenzoate polyprenyltransferase [Galdieria sulphuraria]|uniref:4-hydroxybenzoate polyprenyltransferase n=1 Tax=Galdieria sulphuraria TaxID=130081 RepID=M2Y8B4_GALSU|nr:4-hydroxybenzoate polyprenyltransferase [Galdieria sulphuraria]EME32303.1 4-hydroxybenzoate polyprenyltransferase [Galdieria sulphuraria]|eukprot:XP_005708823.1 4-hydroxybenzoate polyprenyltransferase [Galdieria sulphuraria]